jgi:hypothetical protein
VIWSLEWRAAFAARRLFALNTVVPFTLVAAVALGGAPRAHAAMVYALLIAFFGTFGGAIPLVRDAESGLFGRLVLAGVPPARLLAGRIAAAAAIDLLQLLPSLALIAATAGAPALTSVPLLGAAAAIALVAANTLGVWVAAAARSIAEAALLGAVVTLLALHLSGVFRTPVAESAAAAVEPWLPFRALHAALRAVAGTGDAAAARAAFAPALATTLLALVLTGGAARIIAASLARATRT